MKLAVVINISSDPGALGFALKTQALLLEHMGPQLHSIRLAVPRLLERACLGAVADLPDTLVIVGGPRAGRRAGQIAHERRVPIVFLPGARRAKWTTRLWGALSLEEMIEALAREEISALRLGMGSAGGQIFFESASCGVLPQVAPARASLAEAEGADEWLAAARSAARLARLFLRPKLRVRCDASVIDGVSTLEVRARGFFPGASGPKSVAHLHSFSCEALRHPRATGYAGDLLRALIGGDWTRGAEAEHFDCGRLCVEGRGMTWALLDGDPICFSGPVVFRFLPRAVETFAFGTAPANGSPETTDVAPGTEPGRPRGGWNRTPPSHVATVEFRGNGKGRA
jgi:hypothetical protein